MKDPDPNASQVGGEHYRQYAVQPWDAIDIFLPKKLEGSAIYLWGCMFKYLVRMGAKGSIIEDLEKLLHYGEKLKQVLEERMAERTASRPPPSSPDRLTVAPLSDAEKQELLNRSPMMELKRTSGNPAVPNSARVSEDGWPIMKDRHPAPGPQQKRPAEGRGSVPAPPPTPNPPPRHGPLSNAETRELLNETEPVVPQPASVRGLESGRPGYQPDAYTGTKVPTPPIHS